MPGDRNWCAGIPVPYDPMKHPDDSATGSKPDRYEKFFSIGSNLVY